jgi:hypothetical protein
MKKDMLILDENLMKKLGIDVKEVVEYLENKDAHQINPIHVSAYHYWKRLPTVASS